MAQFEGWLHRILTLELVQNRGLVTRSERLLVRFRFKVVYIHSQRTLVIVWHRLQELSTVKMEYEQFNQYRRQWEVIRRTSVASRD